MHDEICLSGLSDEDRQHVQNTIAVENCMFCNIIDKARADERSKILSNHDPLCVYTDLNSDSCITCRAYAQVRASERQRCIDIVTGAYLVDWCGEDIKDSEWNTAISVAIEYLVEDYDGE